MYRVLMYEDEKGRSELEKELMYLAKEAIQNKDARIQFKQITYCIELLKQKGTRLPNTITKHLVDDLWELRPGNNRIIYFYFKDNTFVLLHMFRKRTQKTPRQEILKAKTEYLDYIKRNEGKSL